MRFGHAVRATGKVLIALKGELPAGAVLRCRSELDDGCALPAVVVRGYLGNELVAAVPLLQAVQTLTVDVLDASGHVVESCRKRLHPLVAAVESKANGALRKGEARRLREVDLPACAGEAWVHVNRIVADDGNPDDDVVRFTVKVLVNNSVQAGSSYRVWAFDEQGQSVVLENVVELHDSTVDADSPAFPYARTIVASVRKKLGVGYFLAVEFQDSGLPQGFAYVDRAYDWRVRWTRWGMFNLGGDSTKYPVWFLEHHRATTQELAIQRVTRLPFEPLFSIIVPLYETPLEFFCEMVESALAQTYDKFELVLVNASPANEGLCRAVEEYHRRDGRVVVCELEENRGITLNTNEGIRAATGDFLCFFDHDDTIEPDLLFEYAKAINDYPDTDLLYCDEDKLIDGGFRDGVLKPDYDSSLLLTSNVAAHMLTVRASIVEALDHLPGSEYDGSQDHNLTLVVAEHARNIFHLRKIRYHWRAHPASTAENADSKPWAVESGRLAVQQHLDRLGVRASVSNVPDFPNCYQVDYALPEPRPLVTVLVAANDKALLERCLRAAGRFAFYDNLEVAVVWQGEPAVAERAMRAWGGATTRLQLVSWEPGESVHAAFNRAVEATTGEYLTFLLQSTEALAPRWVELLMGNLMRPRVGACAPRLLYPDDLVRQTGIVMSKGVPVRLGEYIPRDSLSSYTVSRFTREVTAIDTQCLVLRRGVFQEVGGFDTQMHTEWASFDLCRKIAANGLALVVEPRVEMYAHVCGEGEWAVPFGAASGDTPGELRERYAVELGTVMARWPQVFGGSDPHYNPNYAAGPKTFALDYPVDSLSEALD